MNRFETLLEICGGSLELAYQLKIRQQTVESWAKIGIPQKYWSDICSLADNAKLVNPTSLFKLNERIYSNNK